MQHPTPINPLDHAVYRPDKMGKATLFRSDRVMVGLNAFEPGQEHKLHAHAGMELLAVIERTPAERETVAWRKSLKENDL